MIGPLDFWMWTSGEAVTPAAPLPLPARASIVVPATPATIVVPTQSASLLE